MEDTTVVIIYTNYKGITGPCEIIPKNIYFGTNKWHSIKQWLLIAHDVEKDTERTFAMRDILSWE